MLIYVSPITQRADYVFRFIFTEILGVEIELTNQAGYFKQAAGPKLNYSHNDLAANLHLKPHSLLFEEEIEHHEVEVEEWEGGKIFFQADQDPSSLLPFDVFAASFYLISRYEEVLPHTPDIHGRFRVEDCLAYRENFLHRPVIDEWAYKMAERIQSVYPEFVIRDRAFQHIPTINIDNAYAYLYKGLVRTIGETAHSLFQLDIDENIERTKVLTKNKKDPLDNYQYMDSLHARYGKHPLYFFHLGDYGKYDKNISHKRESYRALIQDKAAKFEVGIIPSYKSAKHHELLEQETERLSTLIQRPVTKARKHYIKLDLPHTYKRFLKVGITEDYSMGFPTHEGFRAGTCTPFYFYDLETEEATHLRVYPFQVMDTTLKHYQHLHPEDALTAIKNIIDRIQNVNGTYVSLWHNESFSDRETYGWNWVYDEMMKYIL